MTTTQPTTQLIALPPGIYILGLQDPEKHSGPLSLGLYPAPGDVGEVGFFQRGNKTARSVAFLQHKQEELLVRVRGGQTQILLVDFAEKLSRDQVPVAVKIDRLEPKGVPALAKKTPQKQMVGGASPWLPLRGHFANGEKFMSPKGVVGAPDASEPIASFGVDASSLPPGLQLNYTCRKAGSSKLFSASAGNVLGSETHGAIVSVCFSATDGDGAKQKIKGHVVFAGHPPLAIVSGKEISGPTGREVLVALRIAVSSTKDQPGTPLRSVWHDPAVLKSKPRKPQKG